MNYTNDYRVNQKNNGEVISVEVTCCSKKIGEMRFKDDSSITCPDCNTVHRIKFHHNHFHITQEKQNEE
ncbi:MAG: hypothetical protein K9L17_05265 [Clostridiales bacterium]|nr:hypothetical protein [Clostridiales bacterium]MCF8022080.1 hypothetical protein [Clostridiales bacterium]